MSWLRTLSEEVPAELQKAPKAPVCKAGASVVCREGNGMPKSGSRLRFGIGARFSI
jgi:hypothetical protein